MSQHGRISGCVFGLKHTCRWIQRYKINICYGRRFVIIILPAVITIESDFWLYFSSLHPRFASLFQSSQTKPDPGRDRITFAPLANSRWSNNYLVKSGINSAIWTKNYKSGMRIRTALDTLLSSLKLLVFLKEICKKWDLSLDTFKNQCTKSWNNNQFAAQKVHKIIVYQPARVGN